MVERVVLEGFHAVKHAVRFGAEVGRVVVVDREKALGLARSHAPDLVEVFEGRVEVVGRGEFERVIGRSHPTGVGGVAERPVVEVGGGGRGAPLVLLDNPRNLGNFGAVIRVAAGLGAGGVVSLGDVDPVAPERPARLVRGCTSRCPVGRLGGLGEVARRGDRVRRRR